MFLKIANLVDAQIYLMQMFKIDFQERENRQKSLLGEFQILSKMQ